MKTFRKIILWAMIPLSIVAGSAHAEGIGRSVTYLMPQDYQMMMEKLTPEQRTQAINIQQKMMQMEMDHQEAVSQMEMKHEREMMQLQNQLLDLFKGH
ncbi:hypothetical protein [Paraburkholderia phytofirmans]|uniref:hypothetical protein n=1 Tax=Paraburkholderia phytofirmans TaxID=261302 RepID=UPI0038BA683A